MGSFFVRVNNTQTTKSGKVYARDYVIDYTSFERNDLAVFSAGYYSQRNLYTAWGERLEQFTDRDNGTTNGGLERLLYVHEDIMGNTMYYSKDNGQSFGELRYDVWGAPTLSGKLLNNDNGNFVAANFTGHTYDTVLDIYFAEARFYDAKYRQWLATDPIKDGLNWYAHTYPLSKILLCSDCRTTFRRKISSSQVYWGCEKRDKQKSWCRTSIVPELSIYKAFCCLYNCIHHNKVTHIELLLHSLVKLRQVRDKDNNQIQMIDQQIQELLEQHQMLSSLRAKGVLDAALCIAQQHELNQKLERLRQDKKAARTYDETDDAILRTQELLDLLETGPAYMDTFDEQIFKAMVRKIVVYPEDKLVFHLHNGLELEERLERTVRR